MTHSAFALLAALALSAPAIAAQSPRVPAPVGARVRVAVPPRVGWTTGTVTAADTARIVVRPAPRAAPDTFLLASVQALEVSRDRLWLVRAVSGALIGGALGTAAGAGIGAITAGPASEDQGLIAVGGGALGFAVGTIVGGLVGAGTARERWHRIPVR